MTDNVDKTAADPHSVVQLVPIAFTEEQLLTDPILEFFEWGHLPEHLQRISEPFQHMAARMIDLPRNAERSTALRKLLEAKDCAVRAAMSERS